MEGADLDLFERSLRAATAQHTGAALDAALEDLGWADALAADPRSAVSLLFGLQGASGSTSSALGRVVLDALGVESSGGVVLPPPGSTVPPRVLDGGRLTVRGLGTAALGSHDTVLVVARAGGDDVAVVAPTSRLSLRPVDGIDPGMELVELQADAIAVEAPLEPVAGWPAAIAAAQRAVGHELVGAARAMLDLARTHAMERIQFGRPISQFQAVRHRLAETLVAIEIAEAVLDAAWLDGSPETAAMAKALAGRGARATSRHCQQVLAGIGFTTEHPLHRYVRRILVLDELAGSARALTRDLGDHLLATKRLPPPLPL